MATMNISLPDQMKDWVERQADGGRYSNSSDYVRDQVRAEQIAATQAKIDEGLASGVSPHTLSEIFELARAEFARQEKAAST